MDPVETDGDKYKVIFENDKVRVLDYTDKPGEITHKHQHPDFVLYALTPFKRRITHEDGSSVIREFNVGDVIFSKGEMHIGENIGDIETHAIIVEMKK